MRRSAMGLALGVSLLGSSLSLASSPTGQVATVRLDGVELRSGPSFRYAATGVLRKGEVVTILHRVDAQWVAVTPRDSDLSWVNHRFLGGFDPNRPEGGNAVIMQHGVEVRVGVSRDAPPTRVTQVTLPRGAIVEILGSKRQWENSVWYPIAPPAGEYRYLPANALATTQEEVIVHASAPSVEAAPAVKTTSVQLTRDANPDPSSSQGVPDNRIQHPLWQQARQAEQAGQYAEAEHAYAQLIQILRQQQRTHELLICYNHLQQLRESPGHSAGTGLQTSTQPQPLGSGPAQGGASNLPAANRAAATARLQPPANVLTSQGPRSSPLVASSRNRPTSPNNPGGQNRLSTVAELRPSGPGMLRRSGFYIDGLPAYVHEAEEGGSRLYVTAQPGVRLNAYLNRRVELYGPVMYRGDIRGGNYMKVNRVTLLR